MKRCKRAGIIFGSTSFPTPLGNRQACRLGIHTDWCKSCTDNVSMLCAHARTSMRTHAWTAWAHHYLEHVV